MKAPAVAEGAIDLPWLSPCAGSLAALVRLPPLVAWTELRADPGLVLLLARQDVQRPAAAFLDGLGESCLIQRALEQLSCAAFIDWNEPRCWPVYQTSLLQASLAHSLAGFIRDCDPECAWVGGLLAPLGWLTVCAIDPAAVEACRHHSNFTSQPATVQQEMWGLDHTAIARRLCRRWNLPPWLATMVGQLGLPAGIAKTLGADSTLFQVVQLAVALVQQQGMGLSLAVGAAPAELMASLGIARDAVEHAVETSRLGNSAFPISPWEAPAGVPLLADYLRLAIAQRGRGGKDEVEALQCDLDRLQHALEEHCAGERKRLHDLKLAALAELAAGAGHEINNPLAVISGQAQYLLARETEPERCKALQTIVGQTRRIHQILCDLMQFARPQAAQRQYLEVAELVGDVAGSLRCIAEHAQVQLACPEPPVLAGQLWVDPAQLRQVLHNLLRNAIEAAPAEGWAGIRVRADGDSAIEFLVEDNGPGPSSLVREHLFDPFFSGRSAGRGRGLGLATAWRLAQQNDGEVRFDGCQGGMTRFVLKLPLVAHHNLERDTGAQALEPLSPSNGVSSNGHALQPDMHPASSRQPILS